MSGTRAAITASMRAAFCSAVASGLGANSGAAGFQVRKPNLRYQALQRLAKQTRAERPLQLGPTHATMFCQESPKPGETQGVEEVAQVDIRFAITFTSKRQHCVRPGFNPPVD